MSLYDDLAVIILAAGKGTRMKSDLAKVLHKVAGKSMLAHVVESALKVTENNVYIVVGHQTHKVKEEINKDFKVSFAVQDKLLGTGDAVKTALPGLGANVRDVLVLCGDVPLIKEETLNALVTGHKKHQSKLTVLATMVDDPKGYGRIVLDENKNMLCIREEADANELEKQIKKVNTGIYCFDKDLLAMVINEIKPDNEQKEYYLTDAVAIAQKKNVKTSVILLDDSRQVVGVNTLEQLAKAEELLHEIGK